MILGVLITALAAGYAVVAGTTYHLVHKEVFTKEGDDGECPSAAFAAFWPIFLAPVLGYMLARGTARALAYRERKLAELPAARVVVDRSLAEGQDPS